MKKIIVISAIFISILFLNGCSSNSSSSNNSNCDIKGNISSSGEKIYHVSGQQYYDKTEINESKGEKMFCSEFEAQNAGWRKSKK